MNDQRRSPKTRAAPRLVGLVLVAALAACKGPGAFTWVELVPKTMLSAEATADIHAGDVIGVRVWNQDANSIDRARVREDGKISMPFLNDVDVTGIQPAELAKRLEVKLKAFIVNPVVTVVIHERRPLRVSVIGQVAHPGVFDLDANAGVLHAIAAAGGLTPFADLEGVFVLRSGYWADGDPSPARIRFRYADLRTGRAPASLFRMRAGDVLVVE